MDIAKAARELISNRFSYMTSDQWTLNQKHPEDWKDFTASWDRLVLDNYMKAGDTYRERRFCKYVVDTSDMTFQELDDFAFYQTAAINSYAGDLRREFSPVEPAIRKNTILLEVIKSCLQAILLCDDGLPRFWRVYVHQFRINCSGSVTGRPTPEGLHRDGHEFVSLHLMDRARIEGGHSTVCEDSGRSLIAVTLENRMDGFLINDRALLHGVSAITPATADAGHRDMLVIDYNREE
jgi:hypothetical protein